jgi:hypothetical protein
MEERDWWNHGINPITGYRIEYRRDPIQEQKKYEMETLKYARE